MGSARHRGCYHGGLSVILHMAWLQGTERTKEHFNIFLEYVPGGSIASLLAKFGAQLSPGSSVSAGSGHKPPSSHQCTPGHRQLSRPL